VRSKPKSADVQHCSQFHSSKEGASALEGGSDGRRGRRRAYASKSVSVALQLQQPVYIAADSDYLDHFFYSLVREAAA
jgi:hypothetical protein